MSRPGQELRPSRLIRRGVVHAREDRDLIAVWVLLLSAQPLVPPDSLLGREGLLPWAALTLSVAAALRGRALGAGPHPALPPQRTWLGGLLLRVAGALVPWALLAWALAGAELAGLPAQGALILAPALTAALVGLRWATWGEGRTAWQPASAVQELLYAVATNGVVVLGALWLGWFQQALGGLLPGLLVLGAWLGLALLGVGVLLDHPRDRSQRRAAGLQAAPGQRRAPWTPNLLPYALALLGPLSGALLVWLAQTMLEAERWREPTFTQAFVLSLYGLAWARVLWPRALPLARTVLLHEVIPAGGREAAALPGRARPFGAPPDGALRIHPLELRRTRVVHPWVVPVVQPSVASAGLPPASPWPTPPTPSTQHVLGHARFELDPQLERAQMERITIRFTHRVPAEGGATGHGHVQRIVVLRAYPEGVGQARMQPTFTWDEPLPADSVQIIDNRTAEATLEDGDIILIASGGRGWLYEVELGVGLEDPFLLEFGRVPQLEDYVQVSR